MTVPPRELAGQALLACCAAPEGDHSARFAQLSLNGWDALLALAELHRAAPLLQACLSNSGVCPPEYGRRLAERTRDAAMHSLAQGSGLVRVITQLRAAGFDPVALKGVVLAFHAYPQPQLRSLRDIDLLLPPDQVEHAQEHLLASGDYQRARWAGHYDAGHSHQLPEILDRETGLVIELHHRLCAVGWSGDRGLTEKLWDEAETIEILGEPIRVPSPQSNFLHLVEHAAVHHLFSNGPLILADLHYLARSCAIDWVELQAEAERLELARPLKLVAQLAHRHGADWVPDVLLGDAAIDAGLLDQSAAALLDDDETHRRLKLLLRQGDRARSSHSNAGLLARALQPDRDELARLARRPPASPLRWIGYPRWLAEKGVRYLAASRDRIMVSKAVGRQRLRDWLERG